MNTRSRTNWLIARVAIVNMILCMIFTAGCHGNADMTVRSAIQDDPFNHEMKASYAASGLKGDKSVIAIYSPEGAYAPFVWNPGMPPLPRHVWFIFLYDESADMSAGHAANEHDAAVYAILRAETFESLGMELPKKRRDIFMRGDALLRVDPALGGMSFRIEEMTLSPIGVADETGKFDIKMHVKGLAVADSERVDKTFQVFEDKGMAIGGH
jgi:hypothetical protein